MSKEEFDTIRTSIYISSLQAPEVVKILNNLDKNKRSQWIRDACMMRLAKNTDEGEEDSVSTLDVPNQGEDSTETPPPSPLENILDGLKKVEKNG